MLALPLAARPYAGPSLAANPSSESSGGEGEAGHFTEQCI